VRLPTTTLAQADAGVGVKNGLNAFGQKNFIGAFAVPHAVINDFDFLDTLPPGEKRAGYAEAVKVALIRDAAFFGQLERDADALAAFEPAAMERLIRRSAELHVAHIAQGGDPFEFGSARPLDFGHWAAHKLERLSHFRLGHGAAVAIGLMLDVLYSRRLGWLDAASAGRVGALLRRLGFDLFCPELASLDELLTGLEEFRAHLGGPLTVTMLKGIGEGFEVHEVMAEQVRAAAEELPGLSRRACP
jgi:3-dehydroquinate synthase